MPTVSLERVLHFSLYNLIYCWLAFRGLINDDKLFEWLEIKSISWMFAILTDFIHRGEFGEVSGHPGVPRAVWDLLLTKFAFAIVLELLLVMRCWSHKSLLFSRLSLILLKSGSQQCCPQPHPHSIVSGFHFPTSCREGRRKSRKISSHYFSILCCLNNIHNKPSGKSLIYCHSFSTIWVYFLYFCSLKELKTN